MRYWINTVSYAHVQHGLEEGFTQANHGRDTNLKRLTRGDLIVFYSPRTDFENGEPLQHFTAIARVLDEVPYQVAMTPSFHPWRRRVESIPCQQAPIRPLIADLGFIEDKRQWGFPFRRGLFEISHEDFHHIAQAMQAKID